MPETLSISPATDTLINNAASTALAQVLEALGEEAGGRTGGMLRIFLARSPWDGPKGWIQLYQERVGEQADEMDWQKYEFISFEKFLRLSKMWAHHRDLSAWSSRNPEMWEYGGAFILEPNVPDLGGQVMVLVSFSGLPEKADETLIFQTVTGLGWGLDSHQLVHLAAISKNTLAMDMLLGR